MYGEEVKSWVVGVTSEASLVEACVRWVGDGARGEVMFMVTCHRVV